MVIPMKILRTTFIAILSIIVLSSCNSLMRPHSKQTAGNKTKLSLKTNTSNSPTSMNSTPADSNQSGIVIATPNDTLRIDTAKVMIREIEFHKAMKKMADSHDNWQNYFRNEDSTEFEMGPLVLNLNLDTTLTTIAINKMPNGTYNYLTFQIHRPLPNQSVSDSDFVGGPNNEERFSIVVKGTYNGKPFVFKTPRSIEEHMRLNPPLTISDSLNSYNATINVNVSKWFVDKNGNILDPTNPNNVYAINWSIRQSFNAYRDNNDDGFEDHTDMGGTWHHQHNGDDSTKTSNGNRDN